MKTPTKSQIKLLKAIAGGNCTYTTWGGKPFGNTPGRVSIATINACVKAGWINRTYPDRQTKLILTEAGKKLKLPVDNEV